LNQQDDIEEIKKLKARYFRLMDKKLWDEWRELFTEDVVAIYHGPHPEIRYAGREDMVSRTSAALADAVTVHHGHMPEIELTSPTTATGIWAMFDRVKMPGLLLKGYGHYEEEYVKRDGRWRIRNLRLTRLHVETTPDGG
jgi:hypothetical protein